MAAFDSTDLINFNCDEFHLPEVNANVPILNVEICDAAALENCDDNPFDMAVKQVSLMTDCFESVFYETKDFSAVPLIEVQTAQLLSISGDESSLSDENRNFQEILVPTFNRMKSAGSVALSSISSISSPPCLSPNLDSVFDINVNSKDKSKLNTAFIESASSIETKVETPETIDESCSILNKGFVNKSDSGSGDNSVQDSSVLNDNFLQNNNSSPLKKSKAKKEAPNLLKLSLVKNSSPHLNEQTTEILGNAVHEDTNKALTTLSKLEPSKSDDSNCEDLMSVTPPVWVDSESDLDFERDLELLKIPILEKIQKEETVQQKESAPEESISMCHDSAALKEKYEKIKLKSLPSDVGEMIYSLKKFVLECDENKEKKAEANNLLENLSTVLTDKSQGESPTFAPPQLIIRQGTFDVDKRDSKDENHNTSKEGTHPIIKLNEIETCSSNIQKVRKNSNDPSMENNSHHIVMGTPVVSAKKGTNLYSTDRDGSPDLTNSQMRRRSQSLSLAGKSGLLRRDASVKKTPLAAGSARRSSFSSTLKGSDLHSVRRSIYGPINKNLETAGNKKGSPIESTEPSKSTKPVHSELLQKKLRTKSNESVPKSRGPLKATVPLNKIAPMIVTPSVSSPIDDKQKLKPITSTPIMLAPKAKGFPNACSTPTPQISPLKCTGKSRTRYSYMSSTPNPKGRFSHHQRRRSLTEIKSPRKGMETVKESGSEKAHLKSLKIPQNFARKTSLPQKRGTFVDNKENKVPRSAK